MAGTIRLRQLRVCSALMRAAVGLAVQGCSADDDLPRQSISGLIRLDDKPLPTGIVHFYPARPEGSRPTVLGGAMIRNGRFFISRDLGLVPGKYTVADFSPKSPTKNGAETTNAQGMQVRGAGGNNSSEIQFAVNLEIEIKDSRHQGDDDRS